jgi:serine/threonine protein kinase
MGEIYLAKSRGAAGFEKTVIIKKILEHLAQEEEFVTKFLDEGRIVVNLTHGNIVPVFDMGEEDGEYFIAMEYVHGRDLRDILKRADAEDVDVPLDLAIHIVAQVCNGLDYAHRKTDDEGNPLNIVHRDISPSNIMLSREGEVKIIDFGIARAASRAAKTASGRIQGKICYMSPEQASGRPLDARSDIFSAGVVLYELLTGVRPFQGESDMHSLDLVRKCNFKPPSTINPDIPETLDAIVERAMTEDPDERYQRIHEFHVELLEFAHSQGRAVMSHEISAFVKDLFPEGFEREDLRKAREKAPSDGPMNLDDALNAELDKLQGDVDPLQTTAKHDSTPDERRKTPSIDAHTATLAADESSGLLPAEQTGPTGESSGLTTDTADGEQVPTGRVDEDENRGFKRWLAIAVTLGIIAGAGAIWYLLTVKAVGKVYVETQPSDVRLRIDGNKTIDVETPYELELEEGEHTIEILAPEGYRDRKFVVEIEGGEIGARRIERSFALDPLPEEGEEQRTFIVKTEPPGAAIRVDKKPRGSAPIKVTLSEKSNNKVIVTASADGCRDTNEIILFDRAQDVVPVTLNCPVASTDTGEDAQQEESVAAATPDKQDRPRKRRLVIATSPDEARLTVNGESVGSKALERTWRTDEVLDVRAELKGYESVTRRVRVGDVRDRKYIVELDKKPTGCVRVNLLRPHVLTLVVDGREIAAERADRIDLPVGTHQIVAVNESADFRETFTVEIDAGEKCALLDSTSPTN